MSRRVDRLDRRARVTSFEAQGPRLQDAEAAVPVQAPLHVLGAPEVLLEREPEAGDGCQRSVVDAGPPYFGFRRRLEVDAARGREDEALFLLVDRAAEHFSRPPVQVEDIVAALPRHQAFAQPPRRGHLHGRRIAERVQAVEHAARPGVDHRHRQDRHGRVAVVQPEAKPIEDGASGVLAREDGPVGVEERPPRDTEDCLVLPGEGRVGVLADGAAPHRDLGHGRIREAQPVEGLEDPRGELLRHRCSQDERSNRPGRHLGRRR